MDDKPLYSSPCSMAETNPAYHGFLPKEEIRDLLVTLLHAERAGARICQLSQREAPSERHRQLLRDIHRDEAKSCRVLIENLKSLRFEPDSIVGDFADKCLAISDFNDRLRFLNRGQGWVAKKIAEALPRIQYESVRQQLTDMLVDHRRNIDTVNAFLKNDA